MKYKKKQTKHIWIRNFGLLNIKIEKDAKQKLEIAIRWLSIYSSVGLSQEKKYSNNIKKERIFKENWEIILR